MTDQSQEPTMEEILASIRRIISEDDQPAETAAAAPAAAPAPAPVPAPEPVAPAAAVQPAPFPAPEPESIFQAEEDVLELTEPYQAAAVESIGDLDVSTPVESAYAVEPDPEPTPEPEPAPAAPSGYDSLVGESAAASAASAFAGLHASLNRPAAAPVAAADLTFASGSTVEGMVAEMLRPLLKDWLDANLPGIVETAVRKEVERISHSV